MNRQGSDAQPMSFWERVKAVLEDIDKKETDYLRVDIGHLHQEIKTLEKRLDALVNASAGGPQPVEHSPGQQYRGKLTC